jgi:lipoprotein-anchoring transpeptidase ErfK/SrfK
MTEHDPEAVDDLHVESAPSEAVSDRPTAPSESEARDGAPAAPLAIEAASALPRPPRRMSRGRYMLSALGAVTLVVALIGGSVFAAQRLTSSVPLAPEASLLTTIASGQQSQPQAGLPGSTTQASCDCAPKHSAYASPPFQPTGAGQVVIVSLSKQQLWAYQNGQLVMTSLVTTGMPQLPTPTGTYHIMMKEANVTFYSPWPYGTQFYYSPEHINYAMLFRAGGFYIHDAPWRETFGPGTNVPHTEPDGTTATGSHGCVNMPTSTAAQLYRWIGVGATVIIRY